MLFPVLAYARAAAPRMVWPRMMCEITGISDYPTPDLSPADVVASQIAALQAEDDARTFRFASPEGKRAVGKMKRMSIRTFSVPHYWAPPHFRDNAIYEQIVGCGRFSIIAGVEHSADEDRWRRTRCTFRVRVWPSGVASEESVGDMRVPVSMPPQDYHWHLAKQPKVRPACYEDDPLQAGVSSGPPGDGCWMVDEAFECRIGAGGSIMSGRLTRSDWRIMDLLLRLLGDSDDNQDTFVEADGLQCLIQLIELAESRADAVLLPRHEYRHVVPLRPASPAAGLQPMSDATAQSASSAATQLPRSVSTGSCESLMSSCSCGATSISSGSISKPISIRNPPGRGRAQCGCDTGVSPRSVDGSVLHSSACICSRVRRPSREVAEEDIRTVSAATAVVHMLSARHPAAIAGAGGVEVLVALLGRAGRCGHCEAIEAEVAGALARMARNDDTLGGAIFNAIYEERADLRLALQPILVEAMLPIVQERLRERVCELGEAEAALMQHFVSYYRNQVRRTTDYLAM